MRSTKTRIFTNGEIVTLDPRLPVAGSVTVRDGRIVSVTPAGSATKPTDLHSDAEVIDLEGGCLVPGFNDDHVHLISMAEYFSRPNLGNLTCDQAVAKMKEYYHDAKPGELLVGFGWDSPLCADPHRSLLDEAFPRNPVTMFQYSGHAAWVNSRTLELLKITDDTPDPDGGEIVRDGSGAAVGLLLDAAARPLHFRRMRRSNLSRRICSEFFTEALRLLAENGITSAQDNTWFPTTFGTYRLFERRGILTARVSSWSYGDNSLMDGLMRIRQAMSRMGHGARRGMVKRMITPGPVKYFIDGTFSTKTAWLTEPYLEMTDTVRVESGREGEYGLPMGDEEWIDRVVGRPASMGRQGTYHAIGDRAVQAVLDVLEKTARAGRLPQGVRTRIEHAQLVRPEDFDRMRELGVVVSAQPSALGNPEKDIKLIGSDRAERAYPFRSILDAGVPLAFGSDIPGESGFNPLEGIHNAVNRSGLEAITAEEALRAYTHGSAYAQFAEHEKGTITPGYLADFALLSANPLSVPPDTIREISVRMTVVDGKIVFRA